MRPRPLSIAVAAALAVARLAVAQVTLTAYHALGCDAAVAGVTRLTVNGK